MQINEIAQEFWGLVIDDAAVLDDQDDLIRAVAGAAGLRLPDPDDEDNWDMLRARIRTWGARLRLELES